ncbi:hypothetical protein Hanom_Chr01g00062791 [Helianthus anomalus]
MAQYATKRQCVAFWFQQNKMCQDRVPRNPTSYSGYLKTKDERQGLQLLYYLLAMCLLGTQLFI